MNMKYLILIATLYFVPSVLSASIPGRKDNIEWDFFLLSQFWPGTSCEFFRIHGSDCYIPPDVSGWTIHGLWPSRPGSEEPAFCNASLKFDYSQIQGLRSKLDVEWPYYNKSGQVTDLWAHEWEKHGTCAMTVPLVRGELNYFSQTLKLHESHNISAALEKRGMNPMYDLEYTAQNFFDAVKDFFNVDPGILCQYEKKTRKSFMDQVYLCFSKEDLTLQNCPANMSLQFRRQHQGHTNRRILGQSDPYPGTYFEDCPRHEKIYFKPYKPGQNSKGVMSEGTNILRFESEVVKEEIWMKVKKDVFEFL